MNGILLLVVFGPFIASSMTGEIISFDHDWIPWWIRSMHRRCLLIKRYTTSTFFSQHLPEPLNDQESSLISAPKPVPRLLEESSLLTWCASHSGLIHPKELMNIWWATWWMHFSSDSPLTPVMREFHEISRTDCRFGQKPRRRSERPLRVLVVMSADGVGRRALQLVSSWVHRMGASVNFSSSSQKSSSLRLAKLRSLKTCDTLYLMFAHWKAQRLCLPVVFSFIRHLVCTKNLAAIDLMQSLKRKR